MGYSFQLAARFFLYAPSHRQDKTYHSLCYTSRGALAGMRNSLMGPAWRIDHTTHHTMSEQSYISLPCERKGHDSTRKVWMFNDTPAHNDSTSSLPDIYIISLFEPDDGTSPNCGKPSEHTVRWRISKRCMNGTDKYDQCRHDTRQLHSSCMGARCSFVVGAFAYVAIGRRIDPSWWTHWAISHSSAPLLV